MVTWWKATSIICYTVNNPMLRDFKSIFDHVTHISYSIININIYKYRANLVDLKIL
jgi:hypothetical protein